MVNIITSPKEVYNFWYNNKERLNNRMLLIAANTDYGIEIYLSTVNYEPVVTVLNDDVEIYKEQMCTPDDCLYGTQRIYDTYLYSTGKVVESFLDEEKREDDTNDRDEYEYEFQCDLITEREIELDEAVKKFFEVVIDDIIDDAPGYDKLVEDFKDMALSYLHHDQGFDIRRPMFLEDEDGNDFFEEYPYEYL